jgi:apolipoprotein N-acyltransferase
MKLSSVFKNTGASAGSTKLRIFGLMAVAVAVVELVLCFTGPFRFVQRPTVVIFPPFAYNITPQQSTELSSFIEKQVALTKSYSITSYSFIEEYFVRTDPDFDKSKLKPADYKAAQALAQELDLDRYGILWVYSSVNHFEVNVSIRDTKEGTILRSGHFVSDSYEDMLQGTGKEGETLNFRDELSAQIAGIGLSDILVLVLLAAQFIVGLLALFRIEPGVLLEIAWAQAFILFVFAIIWARSANMDYVQRYIASSGQLQLAESTAVEQLYAVLRYGPILLLNAVYYILGRTTRIKPSGAADASGKETWIHRYVARWALPWVVLSAGLFGFSFPSGLRLDGIGPLAWIALVPLFLVLIAARPAMGVVYGVVFGALQALIINYWLGTYNYVTLHLITIAFVVEFLVFMIVLVFLIKLSGKRGFLVVPVAWVAFDYVRSIGILGYPWGILGTTQFRFLPLIQIASIGGAWAVDFVVLLGNAAITWALASTALEWKWFGRGRFRVRRGESGENSWAQKIRRIVTTAIHRPQAWFPIGVFALVFCVCIGVGTLILLSVRHRLYGRPDVDTATIVLVQHNTDPRKREYKENFEKLMELTDRALLGLQTVPDLVAWPEGGFKLDIRWWSTPERKDSYWGRLVRQLFDYQKDLHTWLMTGTQDHKMVLNPEGDRVRRNFNSSVLLDSEGQINGFYHKINLVPFSEYFPLDKEKFAGLYETFEKYEISNWGVGTDRYVYQHEKMRIATPICFEDVFSDHVRRFVIKDVDVILNMSNDYWSLSPVEGRQHGILSLFRSVENQRPVLRSTSSGYTVYIDAAGQIQPGALAHYTEGTLIARVPLPEKRITLYTRWGDWFPITCLIVMAAYAAWIGIARIVKILRRYNLALERGAASSPTDGSI